MSDFFFISSSPRESIGRSMGKFQGLLIFLAAYSYTVFFLSQYFSQVIFLIFLPYVFFAVSWLYIRRIRDKFQFLERIMPELCREGDRVTVQISFRYLGSLPIFFMIVKDGFSATAILESPETMIYPSFAQDIISFAYEAPINRGYGDFDIGPLYLKVYDPFGLFEEEVEMDTKSRLRVILDPQKNLSLDLEKENSLIPLGDSRTQKPGQSLDFFGVTEFRPGHDIRFVYWAKYAQTGRLIIKEFEFDSRSDFILLVNTEAAKIKGFGFGSNLKRILKVAAGILEEVIRHGFRIRLMVPSGDDLHSFYLRPSQGDLLFGLEFLASVKGSRELDFPSLLKVGSSLVNPSTILFVASHTLDFEMNMALGHLFGAKAKHAKVHLVTVDDRNMVSFSAKSEFAISTNDLQARLRELDIGFQIIEDPSEEGNSER